MVVSSESTDSMSTCRWAPSSRARRSSGRIRSAASSRPSSGACGRISGVSAVTLTDRFTRGTGPAESRSSHSRCGPVGAPPRRASRAPRGSARRSGRPRRGSRSPRRAGRPRSRSRRRHSAASVGSAVARRLADDEPVCHVADAGGGRGAERLAARRRCRRACIAASSDGGRSRDLVEVGDQVRGEVVDASGRPGSRRRAGRAPRASCASCGRSSCIAFWSSERSGWRAGEGKRVGELAADPLHLRLEARAASSRRPP